MPAISASAPGKVILFGEHAVVYGRPAIAIPLSQVQAKAIVYASPRSQPGQIEIDAPDIELKAGLDDLPPGHPFALLIQKIQSRLGVERLPALRLQIHSSIPIASGLGSGAAISVAMIRALAGFMGRELPVQEVSELAYEIEKIYHGTPSGIDNTVIAYAQPIFFVRSQPFQTLHLALPLTLVVADSGLRSSTAAVVGEVRQRWQADPAPYEQIFDAIGEIALQARAEVETGRAAELGRLMSANHRRLQALGVSCPELDRLVEAALQNGAAGAKLCGAGRGGNMVALTTSENAPHLVTALRQAGAKNAFVSILRPAAGPIQG